MIDAPCHLHHPDERSAVAQAKVAQTCRSIGTLRHDLARRRKPWSPDLVLTDLVRYAGVLLPAVLRDWRGFSFGGHVPERLAVFIDYQNVHLTAHGLYAAYGARPESTLVHPLFVAERITGKRSISSELVSVRVFRGRPNPERHQRATAANDAQTAAWQRDSRVVVRRRDLNYRGWPEHPPREKGVDVALAINLVESAMLGEYDVAVVFTGDTDLLPAVEMAFRRTKPRIEVACWVGAKPLWFPEGLSGEPKRYLPYCHFLNVTDFEAVRDRTAYIADRWPQAPSSIFSSMTRYEATRPLA